MVKYGSIVKIMEEYVTKCRTIAEIKGLLSEMTQKDKFSELVKRGLLNGGEIKYYNYQRQVLNFQNECLEENYKELDDIENGRVSGYSASEKHKEYVKWDIERHKRTIEEYTDLIFQYERRLFDGSKPKEHHLIDYDEFKYAIEKQQHGDAKQNTIGKLEQAQIDSQKANVDLTEDEVNALISYYGNYGKDLNSYINKGARWKYNDKDVQRRLKPLYDERIVNLSNAIDKSGGLLQDTTLYHGGMFDISKMIGDDIELKGYTSCSFQRNVAKLSIKEQDDIDELMYTYKILLPKGTKGICANDDSHGKLSNYTFENEFLLDKGFKGKVVDIDYNTQEVTILASE